MILSSEEHISEYTDRGWWGQETLIDLFHRDVAAHPDSVALVDPPNRAALTVGQPQRYTYSQLSTATDRLASGLLELGVGLDDIVMVQLPNIAELAIAYLAVARIGAIISPLPVQYRQHELRQAMGLTEPKVFITTDDFQGFDYVAMVNGLRAEFPSVEHIVALTDDTSYQGISLTAMLDTPAQEDRIADHLASHPFTANDIFTVCWTSGTEASPKGVPRSHNLWITIAYATVDAAELQEGAHLLNPFPMVNMSGIGGMLVPWLLTSGKLVMHHPLELSVFLQQMGAEQINYTVAPPVLLNLLLLRPGLLEHADLSHVKTIGSGSAPLSPWMVTQWQEQHSIAVVNFFGSNEGTALVSGPNDIPDPAERARYFPRLGVEGYEGSHRIADMILTKLVDPTTDEVITEPGRAGQLAIKGATIFPGYYKRPDLTEKSFDHEGYFYTGDLFTIEAGEDGELNRYGFVGRLKDLIVRGGMKIAPEEIEYLLADHPKIAEVSVVGVQDGRRLGEEVVCAVVVPKPDADHVSLDDLVSFLRDKEIAAYKLPRRMVVFEHLPRNAVGKVLKQEIRAQLQDAG